MTQLMTPEAALEADGLRFIDARWYLPSEGRSGVVEFEKGHLPGAVFFDIDGVITPDPNHPHRAPSPARMAEWLGEAGIKPADTLVVYDETGFFSAPRVWFLLKATGHERVFVLDGGLAAWRSAAGPVTDGHVERTETDYPVSDDLDWPVVGCEAVEEAIAGAGWAIVDARPAGRFRGTEPEPRPGLPSGHMKGARNIPYASLVGPDGLFLKPDDLGVAFRSAGLNPDNRIIATCGSGVSACAVLLGLAEAGFGKETVLYDGSWIDWAGRPDAEIVTD